MLHFVDTGVYFTHLPLLLYILSLNCSKGGARNIKQSLFLHIVLKSEANPKPHKIDIIILPVSV